MMERRVSRKVRARCEAGEKPEITSKAYLSLKLLLSCGNMLERFGYRIKVLNTINFAKSMKYNPFAYLNSEKDILKLVTTFIANTQGEQKGGDPFWIKSETLLYTALIAYLHFKAPEHERNFSTLAEMIGAMEIREEDEEFKNNIDLMFDALAEKEPDHFAVRHYRLFKLAAGDISCKGHITTIGGYAMDDMSNTARGQGMLRIV
jgi:type IV secretory pathway TraG/TraD family ATPase VirD4